MPEIEAPSSLPDTVSSCASIIESFPSETETELSLSDYEYEFNITNSRSPSASSVSDQTSESSSLPMLSPVIDFEKICIPIEFNLKQFLIKITETEDLESVTSLKLRVIARDFSLQRLPIYLPHLRELNLDGSSLMSLRDLGCDLTTLCILNVTRTGLNSLDGLFGLQNLVELYAGHNNIKNLSPCASLSYIKVLDLSRNVISEINSVGFLVLCSTLKHLVLEGNPTSDIQDYRETVKSLLPDIESLDGISYLYNHRSVKTGLEISSNKIISRFPPIITPKTQKQKEYFKRRPNTTESLHVSPNKNHVILPIRPATARTISQGDFSCIVIGSDFKLKDVQNLSVPSKLTSGKPIHGNLALALLEKKFCFHQINNKF